MIILSPSILSADFTKLGQQIKSVERAGAQYLHFDVMDGHFVPNISFGTHVLECVRKETDLILDVHLMISEPEKYIESFAKAGADIINFHIEAVENPLPLIRKIKSLGKQAGITIKPKTNVEDIFEYVEELDMVLIMSVEPGFGGQKFIEESLEKSRKLRKYVNDRNLKLDIEMDGGINKENIAKVVESGTNIIVVGSAIFCAEDIEQAARSYIEK